MKNKEQLRPLTREERKFSEENYHLIMDFLKKSKLDAEEFFDIVVFDFLLSVEKYLNDPQLQAKCSFEAVSYCHASNYCSHLRQLYRRLNSAFPIYCLS